MVQAIPEGVSNVVPYLSVRGAKKAIEFYKAAFGAQLMSMVPMGDDLVGHADLKIGAARVYLADEMPGWGAVKSPASLRGTSVNVHLWVEDCDAAFARAVAAGAKVVMPLTDQFWGDRYGMVSDPFGHAWAISTHKEDLSPEEMTRRGQAAMAQMAQAKPKPKAKKREKAAPAEKAEPAKKATPLEKAEPAKAKPAKAKKVKPPKKAKPAKKAKGEKKSKKPKPGKTKKAKKSKKSKRDKKRKKKSKRG